MGQRLVVNVKNRGETLANAYYHWSAYSTCSLDTVRPIIDYLMLKPLKKLSTIDAIELLRLTGADITESELLEVKGEFPGLKKVREDNRNEGLIAVTGKGISENMYWSEGTIDINLDTESISYGVIFTVKEGSSDFYDYFENYFENGIEDLEGATELNLNLSHVPYSEVFNLKNTLEDVIAERSVLRKNGVVYVPIY